VHLLLLGQSEQVGVSYRSAKIYDLELKDLLHNWKVRNIPYAANRMKLRPRLMAKRSSSSVPVGTPCRLAVLTTVEVIG
jgi:hypothetical protein